MDEKGPVGGNKQKQIWACLFLVNGWPGRPCRKLPGRALWAKGPAASSAGLFGRGKGREEEYGK